LHAVIGRAAKGRSPRAGGRRERNSSEKLSSSSSSAAAAAAAAAAVEELGRLTDETARDDGGD